jgi:hypothetical protein
MSDKGRFIKGVHYSPNTEFKKGEHWRDRKPFWDKEWLFTEYVTNQRNTSDIANQFETTPCAILFWLRKHEIKRRNTSEVRKQKYWGAAGEQNPMFGRINEKNPNWRGGICPERQKFYASLQWKNACNLVIERDRNVCQRCGKIVSGRKLNIHHIVPFNEDILLRAEIGNLITLCSDCHCFIHSKKKHKS